MAIRYKNKKVENVILYNFHYKNKYVIVLFTMNKILALDFDHTMTDVHSRGKPTMGVSYWNSDENLQMLTNAIKTIFNRGWKIYIVSRGDHTMLSQYIKIMPFAPYVADIHGADELCPIYLPNETRFDAESRWACIKVSVLCDIQEKSNVLLDHVYFADDTEINIESSKFAGFCNSFLCENNSTGLVRIINQLVLDDRKSMYDEHVHNIQYDEACHIISLADSNTILFRLASVEQIKLQENSNWRRVFAGTYKNKDNVIKKSLYIEHVYGHFEVYDIDGEPMKQHKTLSSLMCSYKALRVIGREVYM